jgi:hypothetical protein
VRRRAGGSRTTGTLCRHGRRSGWASTTFRARSGRSTLALQGCAALLPYKNPWSSLLMAAPPSLHASSSLMPYPIFWGVPHCVDGSHASGYWAPKPLWLGSLERSVWVLDGALGRQVLGVCDKEGEDPRCHNSVCYLGLCTSVADHLLYLGSHMYNGHPSC